MHDDRLLVEGRLERALARFVRPAQYSARLPMTAHAWHVRGEPVPVAEALRASYEPIRPGTAWGTPWSTSWFRFEAEDDAGPELHLHVVASREVRGDPETAVRLQRAGVVGAFAEHHQHARSRHCRIETRGRLGVDDSNPASLAEEAADPKDAAERATVGRHFPVDSMSAVAAKERGPRGIRVGDGDFGEFLRDRRPGRQERGQTDAEQQCT